MTRIADVTRSSGNSSEQAAVPLLHLLLSMESTASVWYWRYVYLPQVVPNPAAPVDFRHWAEAAMENADRIAERLQEITGKEEFHLEWLPSATSLVVSERACAERTMSDDFAAERLALLCYERLVRFMRKQDPTTAELLKRIAAGRRERVVGLGLTRTSISLP